MTENPFLPYAIYIEKDANEKIYEELVKRGTDKIEDFPFETKKDLFVLAACVGAKIGSYKETFSEKHNAFNGETFSSKIDVPILFSLAYKKEQNVDVLLEPKRVLEIAQGFANGGIHEVYNAILNSPGRPLFNYVDWVLESIENK
jgi:hypothetical protein